MSGLSEQQLADIAARAEAATEGPWCTDSWEIYQGTEYVPGVSKWIGETCRPDGDPAEDDAAFVAAAREDVPELLAEVERLRAMEKAVAEFVAARAEYITAIRNCHPDNGHDYDRWQGHAAARRQLSQTLGLPVAWPAEGGERS